MSLPRRRVHLAPRANALTACGLVAAALGARGTWQPAPAWFADTLPHWRCARCMRAWRAWQDARKPPPAWATLDEGLDQDQRPHVDARGASEASDPSVNP